MQGGDPRGPPPRHQVHRIAQISREREVDISTQHLMRAIRLFIAEDKRDRGNASSAQEPAMAGEGKKAPVVYQPSELPSPLVREEEFAKQLRLARYLAASSPPPSRPLEPASAAKTPKQVRPVTKQSSKATGHKARDEELAKERRRAGRVAHKAPSAGPRRSEKGRSSPSR